MEKHSQIIPPIQSCQGYLWLSDQERPKIIDGSFTGVELLPTNPFYLEGLLFDRLTKKSYALRFIDGKYNITVSDTGLFQNAITIKHIASWDSRLFLLFKNEWLPQNDPLCENMDVLIPASFAFIGFEKID